MSRKSHIWAIPADDFANLIQVSATWEDLALTLGLSPSGGPYSTIRRRIALDGLDATHLWEGSLERCRAVAKWNQDKASTLHQILVEDSSYSRTHLKTRLLQEGILVNKCSICGGEPVWQGTKLVLVLDHINGRPKDHRLENLRMVCPNCNSQLSTFAGRKNRKATKTCLDCSKPVFRTSSRCPQCAAVARSL